MISQDFGQERPKKHHILRTLMRIGGEKSFPLNDLEVFRYGRIHRLKIFPNLL